MENAITVEQLKESVKADYLKALEGRTDGEALMLFLEELANRYAQIAIKITVIINAATNPKL